MFFLLIGNLAGAAAAAAAAANTFSPYAAAYTNAANMMNWNSYSLATYQGLQREGVTYGKKYTYLNQASCF